jgi:hypothetical protein
MTHESEWSTAGGAPRPGPQDPNEVAVERAGLKPESAAWLQQVAGQVDPRLDRVAPGWRDSAQAEAARACAFGLLLGRLATLYPHMREDLSRTAESHPSFTTLTAGSRLSTLEQIVGEPPRATAWLGPLIGVEDPQRIVLLTD